MHKKYFFVLFLILAGSFLVWSNIVLAAAPQISNVKFKAAGDSPKIAVYFDQSVSKMGGGLIGAADFTLGGTSSAGKSIANVAANSLNNIFVLTIAGGNVNATDAGQWTIAASSSLRNSLNEAATSTPVDLNTKGDGAAPTLRGVFHHANYALDVMFSEEIDSQTGTATSSYSNLLTSSSIDTPGISFIEIVPEQNFTIVRTLTSTILGWGGSDTIDVNNIQDLVGNAMAATSTQIVLPSIKISEVKAESATNGQDEFIELYNFGDTNITIASSTLFLHVRTGGTDTTKTLNMLRSTIPDKGYYLIGSQSYYSGSLPLDATYDSSSNDITANSGVYISISTTANQSIIDLLGMGSSPIKETATTTALTAGKSFERKAQSTSATSTMAIGGSDEFKGNSYDSHNNSIDFILRDIPQPQNYFSPKEFPFGGPGASDTTPPQVNMSFPGGNVGEVVQNNLDYVGFAFNESVAVNTVTTSTVKLYRTSEGEANNICQTVQYSNFPTPGNPQGKCNINPSAKPLASAQYTFKILGDSTNATSSTAVRDFANNTLSQSLANKGTGAGHYQITFTPSSGGGGMTFEAPSVFPMGSLPFSGAVNIPTNIKKMVIGFSGNVATSTINTSNVRLLKVPDNSAVTLASVSFSASESKFTSDLIIINLVSTSTLTANTQYKIATSNLTDASSRPLSLFEAFFTTGAGADATGPAVTGKLPSITTGVPVNATDIHIMTDDKIDPTTVTTSTVSVVQTSGSVPLSGSVDFDPFTGEMIFIANNVFLASTSYTVIVNASGTSPCVQNVSGLCLQDNDGNANNLYQFSFTTGSADATGPKVLFANADQRNLSISFDESINKLEAENLDNYSLVVNSASSTLSALAGHRISYDTVNRSTLIENLNLVNSGSFTVTVNNVHDLSGNLIDASNNSAQGTIQNMGTTGGFVGPGAGAPSSATGGGGGMPPINFSSSTFGFVPMTDVRPFTPLAGATSIYSIGIPISQQIKSNAGNGKIVLTFPTGFDVTNAAQDTKGPMASDINGPGPGTIGVNGVSANASARTITVTLTQNTRCDSGNTTPCSGDAHDFLNIDISGIVNSSIPKDGASGGYTVDVKTMSGTTVLESLTSQPFFIMAGGSSNLVVNVIASGANSGTSTIRMFSPMSGPQEQVTPAFASGSSTVTFTGLLEGDVFVFTDPLITLGATDYIGRTMPTPVRVSGATTTMTLTLESTASLATLTINLTAPAGKNVDVFAGGGDKFVVKTLTTTGSQQSTTLKLGNGMWFVGVGPAIPKGTFSGPPPAPDFVMQPPIQINVSGASITESSGAANDGTISFTLSAASLTLSGTVVDSQNRAIVGAEVFAYSPMGGFGTHGSTDGLGKFSLRIGAGVYQVGAFAPGLPPAGETAVEIRSNGTMIVNGQTVSSVTLKLIKPDRTIAGKVLDQSNNPVQGAGVFAYCDYSVANNTCFGPGDHTGAPTESNGSYTLYVRDGTWKIGAFLPGFGELPQVTKVVPTDATDAVNFFPSTNTTFNDISGTICRDDHATGNSTTCGSGDTKVSGVFVRAESSSGANHGVTDQSGNYKIKVPANSNYTIEAFDPSLGRLKPLTSVNASSTITGQDFVVGNPQTITVNVKDSGGNFVTVDQLFIDFFDFTNKMGNNLEIRNKSTSTISLPAGAYKVRASLKGKQLDISSLAADAAGTTADFATSTAVLTVNGAETIKVALPALGTVSGTVYKNSATSGNELADAFVNLSNSTNGVLIGTQANSSGVYTLKVPLGEYSVMAQKPGYFASPTTVNVATSTATTTLNIVVNEATLAISGTINISGSPASKAYVRGVKTGGGFTSAQTNSDGTYTLPVSDGSWSILAMAEGYAETAYSGGAITISGSSRSGININLTTKVTLTAPKVCRIIPSQGGECADDSNGIKVTIPPAALGSDTNAATLTIKQTNVRQQTATTRPVGTGFDFTVVDSSGSKISNFNSNLTLEFTQSTSTLSEGGITTKTAADNVKLTLWSETIKDYDILTTTVDYLDANNALVASPAENLSNVSKIRFKALTSHFSGGGPGQGGDTLAPATPTGITATAGVGTASVSWNTVTTNSDNTAISDLSDYRIWRSAGGSDFSVLTTVGSSVTTYLDSAVTNGTTYAYKITARDTNNNESSQSSASNSVTPYSGGGGGGGGGGGSYVPPTAPVATPTTPAATLTVPTTMAIPPTQVSAPPAAPTALAPSAPVKLFAKRLSLGSENDDVKRLQEFLAKDKDIYPEGKIIGYFGSLTKKAVQKFQEKYGIAKQGAVGYGEVGPNTRAKLNELLSSASAAPATPSAAPSGALSAAQTAQIKAQIELLQTEVARLLSQLAEILKEQLKAKSAQ